MTDSKNATKSGKFLEILGSYNAKGGVFKIDADRVKVLISQGAQVSDTVHNFLVKEKIFDAKKKNVLPKKKPTVSRKEAKTKK